MKEKKNGKEIAVRKNGKISVNGKSKEFNLWAESVRISDTFKYPNTPAEKLKYFPASAGSKSGLPYITDTYVMEILDKMFGKFGWCVEICDKSDGSYMQQTGKAYIHIRLKCLTPMGWVSKDEMGEQDLEFTKDKRVVGDPLKSAYTDALKRVGEKFGIARDVYAGKFERMKQETKIEVGADGVMTL